MLKSICVTHDDMDGAGCRIVYAMAHRHLKEGIDFKILNCSNVGVDDDVRNVLNNGDIGKDTEVVFADICATKDVLELLKTGGYTVRIFDHHRTNFPAQQVFPDAQIVPENAMGVMQSGTSLLYQYYSSIAVNNPKSKEGWYFYKKGNQALMADLVDTIRAYDTYEWKDTNNTRAKQLQTLFFLLGMDRFCARYINRLSDAKSGVELFHDYDLEFINAKMDMEQKTIDTFTPDDMYHIDVRGHKAALTLGTRGASISELGYQFLSKYPEFEMLIGFTLARNGRFDFRTVRDDLDLGAEIASPIGGGGHPKAAGAALPQDVCDRIIDMVIDTLNGNM